LNLSQYKLYKVLSNQKKKVTFKEEGNGKGVHQLGKGVKQQSIRG
jgi:hypothetical protein